jgi:hypothetical protein
MTLTLAIIINVVLDAALLGLLAFVMSRAGKLTPHRPSIAQVLAAHTPAVHAPRLRATPPKQRGAGELHRVLD